MNFCSKINTLIFLLFMAIEIKATYLSLIHPSPCLPSSKSAQNSRRKNSVIVAAYETNQLAQMPHSVAKLFRQTFRKIKKAKFSMTECKKIARRIPGTTLSATLSSFQSFISSFIVLAPVSSILNANLLFGREAKGWKIWVDKSLRTGASWSSVSALYVGAELLCSGLRDKKDSWNSYLSSGIVSAALRIQEGPFAITQGFVTGFAFMYIVDKYIMPGAASQNPAVPGFESIVGPSSGSKSTASMRKYPTTNIRKTVPRPRKPF